jgi:biotin carboxyl carrier protein
MTNSLQAVLDHQKAKLTPEPASEPAIKQEPVSSQAQAVPNPSRQGKRLIGGHFSPEAAKQLRILAAEEGMTVQALLEEALHDLFVKKGKQVII